MKVISVPTNQTVRLVQPPLGLLPMREAFAKAQEEGLDLVEIQEGIFKVMDFNKFQYEQKKKEKAILQKNRQNETEQHTIKLGQSPRIGEHDLNHKIGKVLEFLQRKNSIVTVEQPFTGRESPSDALRNLQKVLSQIPSAVTVEKPPTINGRVAVMTLRS